MHAERQPLRFIDRELFPHMVKSLKMLAAHMGKAPLFARARNKSSPRFFFASTCHFPETLLLTCIGADCNPKDLVLVPNATLALNAIFESVPLTRCRLFPPFSAVIRFALALVIEMKPSGQRP